MNLLGSGWQVAVAQGEGRMGGVLGMSEGTDGSSP